MAEYSREKQRDISGSPEFLFWMSSTTQDSAWTADFGEETPAGGSSGQAKKWLPFNAFTITNNSNSDLEFYRNQSADQFRIIPANSVKEVTGEALRSVKIVPTSADVATEEVSISAKRRAMTSDKLSKHIALNPLIRKMLGV